MPNLWQALLHIPVFLAFLADSACGLRALLCFAGLVATGMETAVLHPEVHLAALRRDQIPLFPLLAEYPSAVVRWNGGAFTPVYEASMSPVMGHERDAALCSKIDTWDGRIFGRNNGAAVGLLPSPGQVELSAHDSHHRRISIRGYLTIVGSDHRENHPTQSYRSSHGSGVLVSRQTGVPMLNHGAGTQSSSSRRFPLLGVQLHEMQPLQHDVRCPSNSAQSVAPGGTAISCQNLKFSASVRRSDTLRLKWADSFDSSAHHKKRLHPEVSQMEVCFDRQGAKPALKVLADGPKRFSGNTFCANKQSSMSASDEVWGRLGIPANKVGTKVVTSLSARVGAHTQQSDSGKSERERMCFEPPSPYLGRKKEKGLQLQVFVNLDTRGRIQVENAGMERLMPAAMSEEMSGTEMYAGTFLPRQRCGGMDAAMKHEDVNEGDVVVKDGFAGQVKAGTGKVGKTSSSKETVGSDARRLETIIGAEVRYGAQSPELVTDQIRVSMMNDKKWAGPSFFNSPPPSSLPVPSSTLLLSRAPSAGSKSLSSAGVGTLIARDKSSLQGSSPTWNAVSATKELRRMLHLDSAGEV